MQARNSPHTTHAADTRYGLCLIGEVIPLVLSRYHLPGKPLQNKESGVHFEVNKDRPSSDVSSSKWRTKGRLAIDQPEEKTFNFPLRECEQLALSDDNLPA